MFNIQSQYFWPAKTCSTARWYADCFCFWSVKTWCSKCKMLIFYFYESKLLINQKSHLDNPLYKHRNLLGFPARRKKRECQYDKIRNDKAQMVMPIREGCLGLGRGTLEIRASVYFQKGQFIRSVWISDNPDQEWKPFVTLILL